MWFRSFALSALVLGTAASAQATSPTVTATTYCASGAAWVQWDVRSSTPEIEAEHDNVVVEVSVDFGPWTEVATGQFLASNGYAFTGGSELPDGSLTVRVRATAVGPWSNGHLFEEPRYAQETTWEGAAESIPVPDDCSFTNPGAGTPGYWKNHPEAWPVDVITLGGIEYTLDEAIDVLSTPPGRDKSYTLVHMLIAAELNVLIGNDDTCIAALLEDAHAWLVEYPLGSGVRANSDAWFAGEVLSAELDAYNNGELCAPMRD